MFTRQQYMNRECTHDEFYGQFVNELVIRCVASAIGVARIKGSTDPHFNDIPLREWDGLHRWLYGTVKASHLRIGYTGGVSLSDTVCVAKAAARRIKAS